MAIGIAKEAAELFRFNLEISSAIEDENHNHTTTELKALLSRDTELAKSDELKRVFAAYSAELAVKKEKAAEAKALLDDKRVRLVALELKSVRANDFCQIEATRQRLTDMLDPYRYMRRYTAARRSTNPDWDPINFEKGDVVMEAWNSVLDKVMTLEEAREAMKALLEDVPMSGYSAQPFEDPFL